VNEIGGLRARRRSLRDGNDIGEGRVAGFSAAIELHRIIVAAVL
jgi:hypothetical protein